jgi:DNA anti-recombination protein RmuC
MNLEPAPRLSKTVFLLIDAGLLLTAFIIVYLAKEPYAPLPFVSAVLCVGLAAIIGLIPFLIDYAADSAEYVQQERARIAEQAQRLNAASESLARAAAQIKAVEEAVHKTAHAAEHLPYRMQEKLAEFNQQLATAEDEEKERLAEELATLRQSESERLAAIASQISQQVTELTALDHAARKSLAAAQEAAAGKFEARLAASSLPPPRPGSRP